MTKKKKQSGPGSTDLGEAQFEAEHPHGHESADELARRLGEDTIERLTSGDDGDFNESDAEEEAQRGGPYVPSDGSREYADDDGGLPPESDIDATPRLMSEGPLDPEAALERAEEDAEQNAED